MLTQLRGIAIDSIRSITKLVSLNRMFLTNQPRHCSNFVKKFVVKLASAELTGKTEDVILPPVPDGRSARVFPLILSDFLADGTV